MDMKSEQLVQFLATSMKKHRNHYHEKGTLVMLSRSQNENLVSIQNYHDDWGHKDVRKGMSQLLDMSAHVCIKYFSHFQPTCLRRKKKPKKGEKKKFRGITFLHVKLICVQFKIGERNDSEKERSLKKRKNNEKNSDILN